jgi:hypothetical protein
MDLKFENPISPIESQIAGCQSLEDLFKVLKKNPILKSDQGKDYNAKEMIASIKLLAETVSAFKKNNTPMTRDQIASIGLVITRTANLRDKVIELLSKE